MTEQGPEESVHVVELNVPLPLLVQEMVPVGEEPVTVAWHVEVTFMSVGFGVQLTPVELVATKFAKFAVIVPGPLTVAVVFAEEAFAIIMDVVFGAHEEKA